MRHYIALIHKETNSDYGVSFPDLPGCVTAGATLDEARANAEEALALHFSGMTQSDEYLPEPSSLDTIMKDGIGMDPTAVLLAVNCMGWSRSEPPDPLILTKNDAAVRQVHAAIAAFYNGDYDICITLAGAAEQMYSERKGTDAFSFFRDHPKAEVLNKEDFKLMLNQERDWLKHPTPDRSGPCSFGAPEAAFMLVRAMSKLEQWSENMKAIKPLLVKILKEKDEPEN